MTKNKSFVCLTQASNISVFSAPSGRNYQSIKGMPFKVEGDMDINHFSSNKRFKAHGFIDSVVDAISPKTVVSDSKSELSVFLDSVKALSGASKDKILSVYDSKEQVVDDVETSKKRFSIPDYQLSALVSALGLDLESDEEAEAKEEVIVSSEDK